MPAARNLAPFVVAGLLAALAGGAGAAEPAIDPDMSLGSPKAPVTVIEYASVTCPHCAQWESEVFPAFRRKYVDTGKVRYVLREFPTQPEELAEAGFMIARCAGASKFFDVVETLMAAQKDLYATRDARAWLMKGAAVGGMNEPQMKACIEDEKGQKALAARIDANAKAFNVQGTPTFIVNGKPVGDGEVTMAELDKAIADAESKPAAHPAAKGKAKAKAGSKPKPKAG